MTEDNIGEAFRDNTIEIKHKTVKRESGNGILILLLT